MLYALDGFIFKNYNLGALGFMSTNILFCLNLLQPENLLLDSCGSLKVSDFGLSAFSKQVRVSLLDLGRNELERHCHDALVVY